MGFELCDQKQDADVILFNTCAVRENAEVRVFGNIGQLKALKEKKPALLIVLCGCMTQQEHIVDKVYKSYPYVGLVFGTSRMKQFPELLYRALSGRKRLIDTDKPGDDVQEDIPIQRDGEIKAWLPIMYGCDNFCSYCVVPYVRGRERSRAFDDVMKEASEIVRAGYQEMMLLGQNVNSYGKTLPGGSTFAQLLRSINDLEGDFRIRFMTSHPKDATKELIDAIAACEKVCNHIHLPVQSGSNRILKQMNRGYTREDYLELVAYAKQTIPNLSLTSDIIVGFPGETETDFLDTLDLIKQIEYTSLYTFLYSPRKGTPAEKMDDPVPAEEKSRRFQQMLKVQEEIAAKRTAQMVGQTYRVLVEEEQNGVLSGRTEGNVIITFKGSTELIGTFTQIEAVSATNWMLKGKIINGTH